MRVRARVRAKAKARVRVRVRVRVRARAGARGGVSPTSAHRGVCVQLCGRAEDAVD